MTNHPEVLFIKDKAVSLKKITFYGVFLFLSVFFIGKTYLAKENLSNLPDSDLFSEFHYVGYIQTASSLLALVAVNNQTLRSVYVGTPLLGAIIQKISHQQIELRTDTGVTHFIKFVGEK